MNWKSSGINVLYAYMEYLAAISEDHLNILKQAISSGADVEAGAELLVAEIDGQIVGSVVLCPENTDAYKGLTDLSAYPEIRMLAVMPGTRKQGIAQLLINECIKKVRERGKKAIGLHTADFMVSAMNLYTRLGFERVPEHDFEPTNDGTIVKAFRYTL